MNKIIVMGDTCKDVNYYGEMTRISPEAPVPIFKVLSKEEKLGMSGNVAANLKAAGNDVMLITTEHLSPLTIKSRYFVGNHYLYRIDQDVILIGLNEFQIENTLLTLRTNLQDAKAVILQDYNKGFFDCIPIERIVQVVRNFNPQVYIVADGHKKRGSSFYLNVDYLKLNEEETNAMGHPFPFSYGWQGRITTLGDKGSYIHTADDEQFHFEPLEVNAIDPTGAGDTFTAWFTSEMAEHKDEERAMAMASVAAGISVEHLGCYAPTLEEVEERL